MHYVEQAAKCLLARTPAYVAKMGATRKDRGKTPLGWGVRGTSARAQAHGVRVYAGARLARATKHVARSMLDLTLEDITMTKKDETGATNAASANEGEGSTSAARNYDKATEAYVKSGKVDKAAQEAKQAVEGPEGKELREAEEKGKKPARN